jgi:hypothetical protein
MKKYLLPEEPKPGKLKGNPKLHKQGAPLRTIVNARNTPTCRIAEIAEKELEEFVEQQPSYIKDTTHYMNRLREIPQPLPEGSLLFCMDVKKLYPNIPACEVALNKRTKPCLPTPDVMDMIRVTLDNNIFEFEKKTYEQIDGTAIGSHLGKNYACTYMSVWD